MSSPDALREGQILTGPLFSEPMLVETVRAHGPDTWVAGLIGRQSERFRRVTLTAADLAGLTIADAALTYAGDGRLLRRALQAYALGIAYEFEPYFGLSISRVDPLPHQLEAVYEHLLKQPRVRFLLADDAGAGKTIMAGLLIRELKLRGLIERILVVGPANLAFQWQRELNEKFDEKFVVLKGADIREQFGVNQWLEQRQIITSLDLAKRADILPGLAQVPWDLVIVDEAHRMSARDPAHVTTLEFVNQRLIPNAIEPRAALADYDAASGRSTLYTSTQNPHTIRAVMGGVLGLPEHKLRVVGPDVGGGFGSKIFHYPEEAVVTRCARKIGRPVKWTASRTESFMTDAHGRDHVTKADLALDAGGTLLPLGGSVAHKGYGLSVIVDLLGSVLTGGAPGAMGPVLHNHSLLQALDPSAFIDRGAMQEMQERYFAYLRSSRLRAGVTEILLPGEPERRSAADRQANGIPLDAGVIRSLDELCQRLSIPPLAAPR